MEHPVPGGVVEKIISLIDERLTERMARRPNHQRIAEITAKLETIKRTCPTSWEAAGRILRPLYDHDCLVDPRRPPR